MLMTDPTQHLTELEVERMFDLGYQQQLLYGGKVPTEAEFLLQYLWKRIEHYQHCQELLAQQVVDAGADLSDVTINRVLEELRVFAGMVNDLVHKNVYRSNVSLSNLHVFS